LQSLKINSSTISEKYNQSNHESESSYKEKSHKSYLFSCIFLAVKSQKIFQHLMSKLMEKGALHVSLIDPDILKQTPKKAGKMASLAEAAGTDAFFVGGSKCFDQAFVDKTIESIKENTNKPVIIFPGSVSGVSPKADAILFMSILNSTNQYFFCGQQALGAFAINMMGLEPIGTAYLIIEPGGTAGWASDVKLLPRTKPEIVAGYGLAAQYFGFKIIYLEAGSSADSSVPNEIIKMTKKVAELPIIVGGVINDAEEAPKKEQAGADIIVQVTFL
jgi:phosphoglycerol geranylgeranyltransferase